MLRSHQKQFIDLAKSISDGTPIRNILAYITQGGGKSTIAQIMAAHLAEPQGYKICWIVPRDHLRSQGADNFQRNDLKRLFGDSRPIIAAHNYTHLDPEADIGYIATYQAVVRDIGVHIKRFQQAKYILILDECHHVPAPGSEVNGEEAAYYEAISQLVELAHICVYMTGSLVRHDNQRIAFIPYNEIANGWIVNENPGGDWAVVKYLRKQAEEERAVVPLEFSIMDGYTTWVEANGHRQSNIQLRTMSFEQCSAGIHTAIEGEWALYALDTCVEHWKQIRETEFAKGKLLVIASSIEQAKRYTDYLRHTHQIMALKADYKDKRYAKQHIERFRGKALPEVDALVTVAMAYEGLDVPNITHVCLLTDIRSEPWVEQAVCRANRTAEGKPRGYVFCMDDPKMARCYTYMENQGATLVLQGEPLEEGTGEGKKDRSFRPEDSQLGELRTSLLGQAHKVSEEVNTMLIALSTAMEEHKDDPKILQGIQIALDAIGGKAKVTEKNVVRHMNDLLRNQVSSQVSIKAGGNLDKRVLLFGNIKRSHGGRSLKELSTSELSAILQKLAQGQL